MLIIIKYLLCFLILAAIVVAPVYIAQWNGKGKLDMLIVRCAAWLFGWTGAGWLFALYWAVKK